MLTNKQLTIFEVFTRSPFQKLERKKIKQQSKEKSTNALTLAIKQFTKEDLIKTEKVGKSFLYLLNHENNLIYYYISLINNQKLDTNTKKTIKLIREELDKISTFYSLIIFGSYATNQQKKISDIDIAIIIENEEKRKKFEASINQTNQKSLIKIDYHIITKEEFLKMLTNQEENLGKEIAKKHLVLYNHEIFYKILKEGIKYGFTI